LKSGQSANLRVKTPHGGGNLEQFPYSFGVFY
jgi:hypothetical protein